MIKNLYKEGYTQNRELSWLRFDERCLNEAKDERVPLLERMKFVSIFSSNLDEFFSVRVGSITDMKHMKTDVIETRPVLIRRGSSRKSTSPQIVCASAERMCSAI